MDVRLFLTDAPDLDGPIGQWANTPEALADLHLPPDAHWGTDKQVGGSWYLGTGGPRDRRW